MNILIMGAGEVGKGLSKRLSSEGHQVKVIDIDASVLEELETHVDVMGMEGNGACASLQLDAGVKEMDLFIGVSDNDERNMIACSIAKQFGVATTIARVRSDEYIFPDRSYYATSMGIDLIINPDEVASVELFDLLENPAAISVADFASGRLKLVGITVKKESIVCARTLSEWPELGLNQSMLAAAVVRNGEAFIPRGDTCLQAGDNVFVIASPSALDSVNQIGAIQNRELKKVVLVGASRVSFFLAERLEKTGTRTLIIDKDEKRCRWFAEELEQATILFGDGRDISILKEAGVDDADGFIAASQDDETNILSALLAKEQGAKRVITLMRKPQYIPLMEHIKPIDVAINPRLVTINAIMRYVRQGRIITMASLAAEQAEAIEYEIPAESPLIGRPLKEGFLPRKVLLGAIVRGDEIIIPRGDDTLQPQDHIVVIALKKSISDIDDLLSENGPSSRLQKLFKSISKTVSP
jgi:trk/ktr system potassium uptake protein